MGGIDVDSIGTFLSFSMLEHVYAPWLMATELYRLSKTGGHLFVVAPWVFPKHEDPEIDMRDYWRMSPEALIQLFHAWQVKASGMFVAGKHEGSYFYGILS